MLTAVLSIIASLTTSFINSAGEKASIEYVDKQDTEIKQIINTKADKTTVDKMAQQIDFIYQDALTRANRR